MLTPHTTSYKVWAETTAKALNRTDNIPTKANKKILELAMKEIKITKKEYYWECGDGCCSDHGYDYEVDGFHVIRTECEDNALLAILYHLGFKTEMTFLDENGEEVATLNNNESDGDE